MSIDIPLAKASHRSRWKECINYLIGMRVSPQEPTENRTQVFKSKGAHVIGSGNFATVVQYPYMRDKVVRISSTIPVNGEQDMYEDYVRYVRRSRSENPCIPDVHAAMTCQNFLFVLLDKYKPLPKPEQDKARDIFYGNIEAETRSEKNLRAAYKLFKRSSLQADDVKGENIMFHGFDYKIVDPLGGKGIRPEIVVETREAKNEYELQSFQLLPHLGGHIFYGYTVSEALFDSAIRTLVGIGTYTCWSDRELPIRTMQFLISRGYNTDMPDFHSDRISFLYCPSHERVVYLQRPADELEGCLRRLSSNYEVQAARNVELGSILDW